MTGVQTTLTMLVAIGKYRMGSARGGEVPAATQATERRPGTPGPLSTEKGEMLT